MELAEVTSQGSKVAQFDDSEFETIVSQVECNTGTRNANLLFAVGFASIPVENDRLIVTEIGNGMYAIGGNCEQLIKSLLLSHGERAIFSTDKNGSLKSKTVWKNDGSISVMLASGKTYSIGGGSDYVGMSATSDAFNTIVDSTLSSLLTAVDGLTGGSLSTAYATAKTAAFGSSSVPSVASTNLKAD